MINMAKEYKGSHGFLATIGHSDQVDYLNLAYLQALNIKTTQTKINNYAVIVDSKTQQRIESKHQEVFDEIVVMPEQWSFAQEWQVRNYSPWKKTIKVDVDLIFTSDIANWWDYFKPYSVLLTSTVENYKGEVINSRWHRKLFDENQLPDTYTALYYFKDDPASADFFTLVKNISEEWQWFARDFLVKNNNTQPRDDEIFSIAAEIFGLEKCTIPNSCYPRFVHMKEPLNELPPGLPWHEQIHFEKNNQDVWVGHYLQRFPFHYCDKNFINQKIVEAYERDYRELFKSSSTV